MSIHVPMNFFRETITRAVTLTTGVNIYVSAHPTPDEGFIAISPASTNLREIIYYTAKGTDGNGTYITVTTANRGLGGTTAQTHAIGEPVRMNVSAETIQEISDALDQIVAGGAQDASTTVKGISKLSVAPVSATNPIAVGDNDPRVLTNPAEKKFGGTGADGALAITSGATNIDLGNAAVVIKNYSSISITGTGSLTFTNPHANGTLIILKCQGNVTITSSTLGAIDVTSMGGTGGSSGTSNVIIKIPNGVSGGIGAGKGVGGTAPGVSIAATKLPLLACGGGGGGGDGTNGTNFGGGGGASAINNGGTAGSAATVSGSGGAAGAGGGALYIECAGAYSCSSTLYARGGAGGQGTSSASGGGGGGGGCIVVRYNTLTSDTGTYTVTGGAGGASIGGSAAGAAGATGYSDVRSNTEFA